MAVSLAEMNEVMTAVWAGYLDAHREEIQDTIWYSLTGSTMLNSVPWVDPDLQMDEGL